MPPSLRGIIFDFNGVLWWDSALQEQAWREFTAEVRGHAFTSEEMATHVHGRNNRYTLEYLTGRTLSDAKVAELTELKETRYRALCSAQGAAFCLSPGAIELLDYVVAQNIPHAIATASDIQNVRFFNEHLQLERWFSLSRIVYDNGRRPGKPAPDIYLEAAKLIECSPSECMVIEDASSGIKAAHAAGIGCIVALAPATRRLQMEKLAGVSYVVENLRQVRREELRSAI